MRLRVEELFHDVADLSMEARARYFAELGVDSTTRRAVEALVAFDSSDSISLDSDIRQVAQRALARLEPEDLLCGPYRLGDLLGRAGLGAVSLAVRVVG